MVIGNNLALVNNTAKKIFNKFPPDNRVSVITNCPGNAKAKNVDRKLCNILKSELFK